MKLYSWYGNRDNFESRKNIEDTNILKHKTTRPDTDVKTEKLSHQEELEHISQVQLR